MNFNVNLMIVIHSTQTIFFQNQNFNNEVIYMYDS